MIQGHDGSFTVAMLVHRVFLVGLSTFNLWMRPLLQAVLFSTRCVSIDTLGLICMIYPAYGVLPVSTFLPLLVMHVCECAGLSSGGSIVSCFSVQSFQV